MHYANSRATAVDPPRVIYKFSRRNLDRAEIKYVQILCDEGRGMPGSRSISGRGSRLELGPFVTEFRCATLSNRHQRERAFSELFNIPADVQTRACYYDGSRYICVEKYVGLYRRRRGD